MGKYKSRATRAGDAAGGLSALADDLRNAETYEAAKKILDTLDFTEIEYLSEEMTSWRDHIEEKFSATQKFEEVSTAADTLEQVLDTLQGLDELTEPTPVVAAMASATTQEGKDEADEEADDADDAEESGDSPEWKDERDSIADEIENAVAELEGVEFPGMY